MEILRWRCEIRQISWYLFCFFVSLPREGGVNRVHDRLSCRFEEVGLNKQHPQQQKTTTRIINRLYRVPLGNSPADTAKPRLLIRDFISHLSLKGSFVLIHSTNQSAQQWPINEKNVNNLFITCQIAYIKINYLKALYNYHLYTNKTATS